MINIHKDNNNNAIGQMDREFIGGPTYGGPSFTAGTWSQFCFSSQTPPYGEYITEVELAFQNLEPHSAEELRAEIRGALKHSHNPRKNITKEEAQALAGLMKDQSGVILTADKGVALVVMDRMEYNSKAQDLLEDGRTYKVIKQTLPTNWRIS